MTEKDGFRYCDRCGVLLTKDNNKCGYEICDKCNEWLKSQEKVDDYRDRLDELEREEYYESKYGKEQE